jgi:hypothetical protein
MRVSIRTVSNKCIAAANLRSSSSAPVSAVNTWMRNETNPDWLYGYDAWSVPLASPVSV